MRVERWTKQECTKDSNDNPIIVYSSGALTPEPPRNLPVRRAATFPALRLGGASRRQVAL